MNKAERSDICRLTGTRGTYVDSHIIPRALTRLSSDGEKWIEAGIGLGMKRRPDSWYDSNLVTRAGEDILSDIDSKAIDELRRHRLVWSGWGLDARLRNDELISAAGHASHRLMRLARPDVLRVFFLSLLWRAAASTRPEFSDVVVSASDLEDLRVRVLTQDPGRPEDYPIQLFQLTTRGPAHNRTPLLERKRLPNLDGSAGPEVAYLRIYFDGLVSYTHLAKGESISSDYLNTCVGFGEDTIVFAHEFEQSRTLANIKEMIATVEHERRTPNARLSAVTTAIKTGWPDRGR